jgi:hypothetical protein
LVKHCWKRAFMLAHFHLFLSNCFVPSRQPSPARWLGLVVELALYVDFRADSTYKAPQFDQRSPEKLDV